MFAGVPIEGNSRTEGIRNTSVPAVPEAYKAAYSAEVSVPAGIVPVKTSR